MKKALLFISFSLFSFSFIHGQFLIKNGSFQPTGLSNQGLVAGYTAQAGPYSIWKPDSTITVNIGGLAPGNGIGGQAHFSDDGNSICGTSYGAQGAEMSRYNQTTHQWSVTGGLGFYVDSTMGGGFGISGDGNTVVGLSWADTAGGLAYAHGIAWNQAEGIIDLGSIYDSIGKSTRANAVSYDGKVVVGWQDFNGPWKSAVWRKNPAGGYFSNEFLLIDSTGSTTDEFNQLGECSVVSANGVWIGGYGDYANNGQPWLWSRPTGVINLGTLPNTGQGYVSGINSDGTMAVGWFDGALFGDPQTPFIWTSSGGLQELNSYIHTVLGFSTAPYQIYGASCLSSNGQYIAGYGIDTTTFNYFAFRVSALTSAGLNEQNKISSINIYPNPFTSQTTITFSNDEVHTIKITDVLGNEIKSQQFVSGNGRNITLDMSGYAKGIYFVRVNDLTSNSITKKIVLQ